MKKQILDYVRAIKGKNSPRTIVDCIVTARDPIHEEIREVEEYIDYEEGKAMYEFDDAVVIEYEWDHDHTPGMTSEWHKFSLFKSQDFEFAGETSKTLTSKQALEEWLADKADS
jgi:hypothetical protein